MAPAHTAQHTHQKPFWCELHTTFPAPLPTPTPSFSIQHLTLPLSIACHTPPPSLSVVLPNCHLWAARGRSPSCTEPSVSVSLGGPSQVASRRGTCGVQGNTEAANHLGLTRHIVDLTRHILVLTRHFLEITFFFEITFFNLTLHFDSMKH